MIALLRLFLPWILLLVGLIVLAMFMPRIARWYSRRNLADKIGGASDDIEAVAKVAKLAEDAKKVAGDGDVAEKVKEDLQNVGRVAGAGRDAKSQL